MSQGRLTGSSHDPARRTNQGFRYKGNHVERLMEAMMSNNVCESSPTALHRGSTYEKIMDLRPRDRSLEINGDFKFKPRSTIEKFTEKASINASNQIKTDDLFTKNWYPATKESTVISRQKLEQLSGKGSLDGKVN